MRGKALLGVRGPLSATTVNGRQLGECEISEVIPQSAAENAGLRVGDKIVAVNEVSIRTFQDLIFEIGGRAIGDTVQLTVTRDGKKIELDLKLGRRCDC